MVGADRRLLPLLAKPAATVEPMRLLNRSHVHTGNVVRRWERLRVRATGAVLPALRRFIMVPLLVACVATIAYPTFVWADDASNASPSVSASASSSDADSSLGATLSTDITDPNNLLGDNVTAVTDAIAKTKKKYGVAVRLLYLNTFTTASTKDDPTTWASKLLQSTDPSPNTVMLAVASQDGNLVVAVSNNSERWLASQATVDELSAAAQEPLAKKGTPDWSGSAIAMMNKIGEIKETSTSRSAKVASTLIFVGVAVLMAALIIVIVVLARNARGAHSRGGKQHRARQARSRQMARTSAARHDGQEIDEYHQYAQNDGSADSSYSEASNDGGAVGETTQVIDVEAYLKRFAQQDTGHSQETRREKRNAGRHEQNN